MSLWRAKHLGIVTWQIFPFLTRFRLSRQVTLPAHRCTSRRSCLAAPCAHPIPQIGAIVRRADLRGGNRNERRLGLLLQRWHHANPCLSVWGRQRSQSGSYTVYILREHARIKSTCNEVAMNTSALRNLPVEQRLRLVEQLWDSIADDQGALALSEAQRQELDRRLDAYELDRKPGRPAEDVLAGIRKRL